MHASCAGTFIFLQASCKGVAGSGSETPVDLCLALLSACKIVPSRAADYELLSSCLSRSCVTSARISISHTGEERAFAEMRIEYWMFAIESPEKHAWQRPHVVDPFDTIIFSLR